MDKASSNTILNSDVDFNFSFNTNTNNDGEDNSVDLLGILNIYIIYDSLTF